MKKLTAKEEEVMSFFWDKGDLFVKQILEFYPDPKPHYNTISTMVRALEEKKFLLIDIEKNLKYILFDLPQFQD